MKKIWGVLVLCAGTSLYAQPGKIKHQNVTNNIAAQASTKASAQASVKASQASTKALQRVNAQAELRAAQQAKFKAGLEARTQTKLKSSLALEQNADLSEQTLNDNTTKNDLNFQKRLHTNLKNVPAPVAKQFSADVTDATNINWSKENGNWYVSYAVSGYKTLNAYHANGEKLYTATRISYTDLPTPVVTYTSATATTLSNHDILLIEVPGQAPLYQLTLMNGNVVYVTNNGTAATNFNSNGLVIR
jgi:hypothetical protein